MSRRVIHRDGDATEIHLVAVTIQFDNLPGFAEQRPEGQLGQSRPEPLDRIGQHEPVPGWI